MRRAALLFTCLALAGVAFGSTASAEDPNGTATDLTEAPEAPESSALLEEGCVANQTCLYRKTNFNELFFYLNCSSSGLSSGHTPGGWGVGQSARNRCGNKTMWLRWNGGVVACMNPGGDRPSPGAFNEVWVAENYGAFC